MGGSPGNFCVPSSWSSDIIVVDGHIFTKIMEDINSLSFYHVHVELQVLLGDDNWNSYELIDYVKEAKS